MVNSFTDLNPLIMSILISVTFSLLMVTPISLVAIAISLTGLGSGLLTWALSRLCDFIFGSIRVNSMGLILFYL